MTVTFHNVTICVEADSPEAAYKQLCEAMDPVVRDGALEYTTDTYSTPTTWDDPRDTAELWGNDGFAVFEVQDFGPGPVDNTLGIVFTGSESECSAWLDEHQETTDGRNRYGLREAVPDED